MMNATQKISIAGQIEHQMKPYLYFRLHERIIMSAPAAKAYEAPDLQINLDTKRHLVYFYVVDLSDTKELTLRESHLNYLLKNSESLFGVITDGNAFRLYENNAYDKIVLLGENTLEEMCRYFNSLWIEFGQYPPLEENDYSYTNSGGAPSIIIDKLDAAYAIGTQAAFVGVAYPIPLTAVMMTNLMGFVDDGKGNYDLNGFIVQLSSNIFWHNGKKLEYLSQLQQCYRRERGELAIDETLLPNYV